MTIVLAAGNPNYIVQLSDRRLSTPKDVVTDESNKAAIIFNGQARLALGFTGVARIGHFDVFDWVLGEFFAAGPPDYEIVSIIRRFVSALSAKFHCLREIKALPARQRGLSFVLSGFVNISAKAHPAMCLISNNTDTSTFKAFGEVRDEFNLYFYENKKEDAVLAQFVGNHRGLVEADRQKLREACRNNLPARAVVEIGVKVIKSLSERNKSGHTIGRQISAICIPADVNEQVWWDYFTEHPKSSLAAPAVLWMFDDKQMLATNIMVHGHNEDGLAFVVPKVHRNARCPCGSGVLYKNCHARFRLPEPIILSPETLTQVRKGSVDSDG